MTTQIGHRDFPAAIETPGGASRAGCAFSRAPVVACCLLSFIAIAVLGGCGGPDRDPPKTDAEKQQALDESAFGDMAETLDRAKGVEALEAEHKRRIDEATQ